MDFSNIDALLNIDPTYLALFGGMSLALVQIVKVIADRLGRSVSDLAIPMNFLFSLMFSLLLVSFDNGLRQAAVEAMVLSYLIASSASGTYSWVKSKVEVAFPEFTE